MNYLKLVESPIFISTAFCAFGIASAHDNGGNVVSGAVVGGLVGIFFVLVFGGGLLHPRQRPSRD